MAKDKLFSLAIDASRIRSGGAQAHIIGLLTNCFPEKHSISQIHVWAYRSLLAQLPDKPWLVKHNPKPLEGSLIKQLFWQATVLADQIKLTRCDILFSTDASTLCLFHPMVVLSQDMLSYEPGVMSYYGYGLSRLRLQTILLIQNLALRRSAGVIFLTRYAGKVIQERCGTLDSVNVIPHGVDRAFFDTPLARSWPLSGERALRSVYVSNAEMYKHQWVVIEAVSNLRKLGYNIHLTLVGGGKGRAQRLLEKAKASTDPDGYFVEQLEFLPHSSLPEILAQADLFIFASSCENMPVTLLEAMAVGLPIACSNRGPMPEVLEDGGVYFDPQDPKSISFAIQSLIQSPSLRFYCAKRAKLISQNYSWKRCADETLEYIKCIYETSKA